MLSEDNKEIYMSYTLAYSHSNDASISNECRGTEKKTDEKESLHNATEKWKQAHSGSIKKARCTVHT